MAQALKLAPVALSHEHRSGGLRLRSRRVFVAADWRVRGVPLPTLPVDNEVRIWREHIVRVRELRLARGWSQAQLAEMSGLSVRTIQRIETGANPGLESLRELAAVFGVDVSELHPREPAAPTTMNLPEAVIYCLRHYSDVTGVAGRSEFWWFTIAVGLVLAVAQAIGPVLTVAVSAAVAVPWFAVAIRRLRDAGQSPWWLLMLLVPVGGHVLVAILLALPSTIGQEPREVQSA